MATSNKYSDPRWQKLRLKVFENSGWACDACGTETKELHAHHTAYSKNAKPWEYMPDTLISLCSDCHEAFHGPGIQGRVSNLVVSMGVSHADELLRLLERGVEYVGCDKGKLFDPAAWLLAARDLHNEAAAVFLHEQEKEWIKRREQQTQKKSTEDAG